MDREEKENETNNGRALCTCGKHPVTHVVEVMGIQGAMCTLCADKAVRNAIDAELEFVQWIKL